MLLTFTRYELEKELALALEAVHDTIEELQAQNKALLAGLQSKKRDILENTTLPYTAFSDFFSRTKGVNGQEIHSAAIAVLWEYFPPRWEQLDGKIGNIEDPGDGLLYDSEQLEKAKAILKDLHQA